MVTRRAAAGHGARQQVEQLLKVEHLADNKAVGSLALAYSAGGDRVVVNLLACVFDFAGEASMMVNWVMVARMGA